MASSGDSGVSPVVGVILIIAVTVVLSASVFALVFDMGGVLGDSDSDYETSVRLEESPEGVEVQVISTGDSPITILRNGEEVYTMDSPQSGDYLVVGTYNESDTISVRVGNDSVIQRYTVGSNGPGGPVTVSSFGDTSESEPQLLTNGLVLHYSFENVDGSTVIDNSSRGNNGTMYGHARTVSTSYGGNATYVDGSGDYIRVPDNPDFDFGSGNFTVSFWMKTHNRDLTALNGPTIGAYTGNSDKGWLVKFSEDGVKGLFLTTENSDYDQPSGNTEVADDEWHHVTFVRQSDGMKYIYVDGALYRSHDAGVARNVTYSSDIFIGHNPLINEYVRASFDDVTIYNTSLSPSEVDTVYEATGPGNPSETPDSSMTNIPRAEDSLLYFDFEGSDSTVTDHSGWGHEGHFSGNAKRVTTNYGETALRLDGSGDYVRVWDSHSLGLGDGDFTAGFWFKSHNRDLTSLNGPLFGAYPGNSDKGWLVKLSSDAERTLFLTTENSDYDQPSVLAEVGNDDWHHAVFVRESTGMKHMYIDGEHVLSSDAGFARQVNFTTEDVFIGYNPVLSEYVRGDVDDVILYRVALSSSEVQSLYENTGPGVEDTTPNASMDGLPLSDSAVGYYTFEKRSDTTVTDESGESNEGKLVNSPVRFSTSYGGTALSLDGTNYMRIWNDRSLFTRTGNLSVGLWVKSTTFSMNGPVIGSFIGTSNNGWLVKVPNGDNLLLLTTNSSDFEQTAAATTLSDGNWHHVMVVRKASGSKALYVDGVKLTEYAVNPRDVTNAHDISVGYNEKMSEYVPMDTDDIIIYDAALSDSEVVTVYKNTGPNR